MEENVALDSSKQKQFVKSIKGIKKKLIKKKALQSESVHVPNEVKDGKSKKRNYKERGLVYLAHIPHGFYENEMTQYFKQFGMVTNVRVIRSKRTGNSKGYAFVEFKEPTVAQIVAETMNNYLMGKRLLKAAYIPPEKQRHHAMRKKWNPIHNPGRDAMIKQKKAYNADKTDSQDLKIARKTLSNIKKTKEKLRALGINYDFFTPVDVPNELLSTVYPNEQKQKYTPKINKNEKVQSVVQTNNGKQEMRAIKNKDKKINNDEKISKVDKKQQKQKELKLKEKGVKPVENFIKVKEDSEDESDSSLDFDSDEYEKLMEDDESSLGSQEEGSDSEVASDDDDDDEGETVDEESDDESEVEEPPKVPLVLNPNKLKNLGNKSAKDSQQKRKAFSVADSPTKKSKFEKQQKNPQIAKKQFKKKK